jgi:hypothetical protein
MLGGHGWRHVQRTRRRREAAKPHGQHEDFDTGQAVGHDFLPG